MGADGGPLGSGDGVDGGVADRAVFGEDVGAEDAVKARAETLDSAAALEIEDVGAKLDGDAGE